MKIDFDEKFSTLRNEKIAVGEICLGIFSENFESSLSFWKIEDYQKHWIEAALKIFEINRTAFITDLYNPQTANFLTWWKAWKVGDRVFFQNQILFFDQLFEQFDLDNPYKFIENRTTETETGFKVSEWEISSEEINNFLKENG